MILCIDVGNSQLFAGIFDGDKLLLRFRYDSRYAQSSDQLGIFLKAVLRENAINSHDIKHIAICSVVPHIDYSLTAACKKYFKINPFVLQAGVKSGLKIQYQNPLELGTDRIANAIAALHQFPNQDIILVDFGTGTTFCAIRADKTYLGGVITAGMRLCMEALESKTAKLPSVSIIKPKTIIARSTATGIQSGLYYSQLATVKEIMQNIREEAFAGKSPVLLGTGGFSSLFADEEIFTAIIPDLVLDGLRIALTLNQKGKNTGKLSRHTAII